MKRKEYFKTSESKNIPLRCPILNYCARRAWTIYLFSEFNKSYPHLNYINALNKEGVLPSDFIEEVITYQGEAPMIIKGANNFYFSNTCQEVNLFDEEHALIFGEATTKGEYDAHFKDTKKKALDSQHYSECAEYNKYSFAQKSSKKSNKKRKYIPYKTKAQLQKEISSQCPFCKSTEVAHFQIHHIDENPSNNNLKNLIMLCPTCHSKITKGEIDLKEVSNIKAQLLN